MVKMSLRDKKIAYLKNQQANLKRSLLGRTNGNEVPIKTAPLQTNLKRSLLGRTNGNEVPIKTAPLQTKQMKMMQMQKMQKARTKPTLMEEKRKALALKQRQMKMPVSKVSIKSFY
jgi:hypothetical protein